MVRLKDIAEGCGVSKAKPEYDDIARAAAQHGLTLEEVEKLLP